MQIKFECFPSPTFKEPKYIMKINNNQNTHFETIKVKPIAGALGAQIDNIDLSKNLPDEIISEIYNALLAYQVIFFRDQKFSPNTQKAFAERIGKPIVYPFVKSLENFPEITPILKKELLNNPYSYIIYFGTHQDTAELRC